MTGHDLEAADLMGLRGTAWEVVSILLWIVLILAVLIWVGTLGTTRGGDVQVHAFASLAIELAGTALALIFLKSFYRRHMTMLLLIQARALLTPEVTPVQASEFVDRLMGKSVKR